MKTLRITTGAQIRSLNFYSLTRISEHTGYADPIGAVDAGCVVVVTVDELGNVLTAFEDR